MTNREKFSTKISSFTDNELATFMYAYKIATNDDILDKKDLTIADYKKWLSKEAELSADEMFEELGYKKANRWCCDYVFDRKNGNGLDRIVIDRTKYGYYYIKHRILYDKYFYEQYTRSNTISEDEDKAIHKKIEEGGEEII